MMTEMMVWIIGPKEEEVVVLFNVAEGALTSKSQVAVQNGLMINTKGTGLLKMKKRPWKIVKKRRTDAKKKRSSKSEVRSQQRAELAPTIFFFFT
uniref:BCL2 associated transcription factor 1 n=1 Tax=Molossus molossus TaxID=27622 RepID=A0A7J8GNJ6_MOLMO|nr:BCL2 associated transcription factor 1 [Molossus molossus]